jgi:pimeloyl-ACP methyl ester carboxylesterase
MGKLGTQTQDSISKTISRTLRTASLIDAFWERWLAHGLDQEDLEKVRPDLKTIEGWFQSWEKLAKEREKKAKELEIQGKYKEAEYVYRQTALYYNLNYWINPKNSEEKQYWYKKCLQFISKADSLSEIKTLYKTISVDDFSASGRIRIPSDAKGCIVIINPIDSSKEELFKYEMDFIEAGFATVSFDGPGQGETFTLNGVIGTGSRWENFVIHLIDYVHDFLPELPIYLFGTSLGGTWVLFGSSHPKVKKAVAVSPAVELEKMNMPTYFMERMQCSCILNGNVKTIPNFDEIDYRCPILVFHGNKDMMVPNEEMYALYEKLPVEKQLIEYKEEGHCCNNKLDEIRKISLKWFQNETIV